ncbi:MAG: glycosyltransferase family 39 protein [Caldilineaceae bacterium]
MNGIPTIRRFLVGATFVLTAILGQLIVRSGHAAAGGAVMLACAAGFAWLTWGTPPAAPKLNLQGLVSFGKGDWFAAAALLAGLAFSIASFIVLDVREPSRQFWILYLLSVSVVALVPAGVILVQQVFNAGLGKPSTWFWILAILLAAAATRLIALSSLPFGTWYDEAANGLEALRIINEPQYRPVYTDGVNASGHYLFLIVAAFDIFGVSTRSIRLISAVVGIVTVGAAYLAGRELFGPTSGLLLAFLVAVSRWSINFSRLGMYNAFTPLFELLAVAFLIRALRRNQLSDYVLAGVSLGLGFCFYAAFQLFAVALFIFVAYLVIVRWRPSWRFWVGMLILALSALIIPAPLAKYAIERPDSYFARVQKTSLFSGKAPGERVSALSDNVRKHVLMFNVRGDPNGRHNLPGEPMLDPVTGALFVIGIVICITRIRSPISVLLLAWLALGLMGGVLSLDFEAPQSLRSITALPAALVLAVVPLSMLNTEWVSSGGRYVPNAAPTIMAILLLPAALYNLNTYFVRQAHDFASWNAFSTPETLTASILNSLGPNTQAHVISLYDNHPTVRFLAHNAGPTETLATTASLPIVDSSDRDLVLILDAERRDLFEEAIRTYPNAITEEITPPFGGPVVLYVVTVPYAVREQLQGFTGRYVTQSAPHQKILRRDGRIDFRWPDDAPIDAPFSVEWNGVLIAESYGPYQFGLQAPAAANLYLDETPLVSLPDGGDGSEGVVLPRGRHMIRVVADSGEGAIQLRWRTPDRDTEVVPSWVVYGDAVTNNGLLGKYTPGSDWSGSPILEQIDRGFDRYFHVPALSRPYTVEWLGKIAIPSSGSYGFALESNDESILLIDGAEAVSSPGNGVRKEAYQQLPEGLHDIQIRFSDHSDHTFITVYWSPPGAGGAFQVLPDYVLFPPQGNYEHVSMPSLADLQQTAENASNPSLPAFISPADVDVIAAGLGQPAGITVLQGMPVVALPNEGRVVMLDGTGKAVVEFRRSGGAFVEPFDVDAADGILYVLDSGAGTVSRFDADGTYLGDVEMAATDGKRARGIGVDNSGAIWIANTSGGTVVRVNAMTGEELRIPVREQMSGFGEAQPVDAAGMRSAGGLLYVTDAGVHKLSGYIDETMRVWSVDIPVANSLHGSHVATDIDGAVYVTEPESGTVAKVDTGGEVQIRWQLRTADRSPVKPVGIDVDDAGDVWVTDVEGGRILRFTPTGSSELGDTGQ